jgi:hypothetical protein
MTFESILKPLTNKNNIEFFKASVFFNTIGFILYMIYIATKGERVWQIATFVCFIISTLPYFIFWWKNEDLNFGTSEIRTSWKTSVPELLMGIWGLSTLVFAIINWVQNGDKIENMKKHLPYRYWQAEALFSFFLFIQVLITGYYFYVKKIFNDNKNITPLLWLGIITCVFLLTNAFTLEIWNITTNFITAG